MHTAISLVASLCKSANLAVCCSFFDCDWNGKKNQSVKITKKKKKKKLAGHGRKMMIKKKLIFWMYNTMFGAPSSSPTLPVQQTHEAVVHTCINNVLWQTCPSGRVVFFFVSRQGPRAKSMREGERKKTNTEKKNSIISHGICPANQQNLDTQLATAKLLLAIHSTCNSADLEAKTLHSDCLTVKRDPLRKHVQTQIYKITDH